jgi:hypothetical protein
MYFATDRDSSNMPAQRDSFVYESAIDRAPPEARNVEAIFFKSCLKVQEIRERALAADGASFYERVNRFRCYIRRGCDRKGQKLLPGNIT